MNANARRARREIRSLARATRATRRAHRNVNAGPASAKHHLIVAGVSLATADRFAGAFSRGMVAADKMDVSLKLRGRRRKAIQVKRYVAETVIMRLATYRPKDAVAAAEFERVAA